MNISNQLRFILLLAGVVIFIAVYFFSRRRVEAQSSYSGWDQPTSKPMVEPTFTVQDDLVKDEDQFELPAYVRKQNRQGHFENSDRFVASELPTVESYQTTPKSESRAAVFNNQSVHLEPELESPISDSLDASDLDVSVADHEPVTEVVLEAPAVVATQDEEVAPIPSEPVVVSTESEIAETVSVPSNQVVEVSEPQVSAAPILSEQVPAVAPSAKLSPAKASEQPSGIRSSRKIIALRVAFPERVLGSQLMELMKQERVEHGKFSIFHRLHDGNAVFSLASMVEPGTFDLDLMSTQAFPGITLFMLLPGPLDGLIAYDQMLSCAQRIAHATNGLLQDERGSKLTAQAMDRLRDDVLDFQHLIGSVAHSV